MTEDIQIDITPKKKSTKFIEDSFSTNITGENGNPWSKKDKKTLINLIKVYNYKDFTKISKFFPDKTPEQCIEFWSKIKKNESVKGHWTAEEDKLLTDWVEKNGANQWMECSKTIPGRNAKQCREHWTNSLAPNLKKGEWSTEEDFLILALYYKFNSWKKIVPLFNGRTENSIKNRFFSQLRKTVSNNSNQTAKKKKHINSKIKLNFLLNYLDVTIRNLKEKFMESKKMTESEVEEYVKKFENMLINNSEDEKNVNNNAKNAEKVKKVKEAKNISLLNKKTKRDKNVKKNKNENESIKFVVKETEFLSEDEEECKNEEKKEEAKENIINISEEAEEKAKNQRGFNSNSVILQHNDIFTLNKVESNKLTENNNNKLNDNNSHLNENNSYFNKIFDYNPLQDNIFENIFTRNNYFNDYLNHDYKYDNFYSNDLLNKNPSLFFDDKQYCNDS